MPILKQLVSGSSHTKQRRSRMDLTREMISAPLGDFRHTMHVGRSGDAFGDTSFLSTHSGEAPHQAEPEAHPHSPRPGLLSRTFRSSKRSQSVTRVDQRDCSLAPPGGSPTFVKNAMSLPFLNDENGDHVDGGHRVPKSLSSSPLKQLHEQDGGGGTRPSNGAAAGARSLELDERSFGELTDLPSPSRGYYGGGMKHAVSVMSFHIDLGPSMLGDILGVMEKEEDDLGYEEGKSSEGRASPTLLLGREVGGEEEEGEDGVEVGGEEEEVGVGEEEEAELLLLQLQEEEVPVPVSPTSSVEPEVGEDEGAPYTPEPHPKHLQHQLDTCSVSSSASTSGSAHMVQEKPAGQLHVGDTDSATFSAPPEEEEEVGKFSSFLEDEDDEIRV
ncbi:cdc42 effector protein 4 [Coregonus clupeaformis]|nr:cdc42 effector protein 4 [Coregonus clupeaformis]XP_041725129.2 cdc42 effector protein 4 [Coregonus clupeaformis]